MPAIAIDTTLAVVVVVLTSDATRPRTSDAASVWMIVVRAACSGVTSQPTAKSSTMTCQTALTPASRPMITAVPAMPQVITRVAPNRPRTLARTMALRIIELVWARSMAPNHVAGTCSSLISSGTNRTLTAPRPSMITPAEIRAPVSSLDWPTTRMPSTTARSTEVDAALAFCAMSAVALMRRTNRNETRNVSESITKTGQVTANRPTMTPAAPVPSTPAIRRPACDSELAARRPSFFTIDGMSAVRAGVKNVPIAA